jgi:Na+-driven multidrug efflux pump
MGGLAAVVFYNFCAAVLRAVGDRKTPLKAMVAASVTNIVLDYIAVFQLGMGIAGAAAATVFSQCL